LASGDNRIAATPLEAILGLEGAGSAAYFRCFGKLLSDPRQWPFPGRVKRPPTDPVNALLSFGYSLLTNKVASAVQLVGFDHFVGYLHSFFYGRPALALDLVNEEMIHPLFDYKVTYRRCLELQTRLLAKVLTGEIDEYPPFLSR
jgi:CRISPR-associated protein Cas1